MITKIFILFSCLILTAACSHIQKAGELVNEEDIGVELKTFEEIDLSDKEKFDQFLKAIRKELSLAKSWDKILPETWNKIGQLLGIYKSLTQFSLQNKILIPPKTKLVLKTDSFCIDPGRPAPDPGEIFRWIYSDPGIPFYEKILKYYQKKNREQKNLIQELIWNLANETYYEDYPEKLKRILNEIDPNAFLKIPSRTRSKIIEEGISTVEEAIGTDIRSAVQIIKGNYYSFQEFKTALEVLKSSYPLPEKQFYSKIPDTPLFSISQSQGYQYQALHFYNPSEGTQILDLSRYFLKPFREDVQRIALTASFGDVDYFERRLEQTFKFILGQMGSLYPKLENEEKKLIREYPYEALRVFWRMVIAERASVKIFKEAGDIDGEADAFRHFVWAGYLTHDLGKDLARRFLNAHESNLPSSSPERKMDEHNNKKGMNATLQLEKENKFSSENLYNRALAALKNRELTVLRPTGDIPDDASY